jgi:hypothetical protein
MHVDSLNLLAALWDAQFVRWVVWVGLIVVTATLLVLVRTRWGQQKPLGKCVVLSLVAHLLLAIYMTTVNIVTSTVDSPDAAGVQVALVAGTSESVPGEALPAEPWTAVAPDASAMPIDAGALAPPSETPPLEPIAEPTRQQAPEPLSPVKLPEAPPSEEAPPPQMAGVKEPIVRPAAGVLDPVEMPKPESADPGEVTPPPEPPTPQPSDTTENQKPAPAEATSSAGATPSPPAANDSPSGRPQGGSPASVPQALQGRGGDHLKSGANGATKKSEAAVAAALRWLAANQSAGGRWNARHLGAGSGLAADGENRDSAGTNADTGLSGLALLAFLASGHTHLEGSHRDTVRRGLEFLLASQDASGSLAATMNQYERMYCHAMATCALSEAYAMTADRRLLPAVQRALQFTVNTQDRASGGWRYQLGQVGDTSQLGWQVMALKSAELGGIAMPAITRGGIERFLRSVASGPNGGLACYQPTRPIPTRSMTAEAMVCRQFLGRVDRGETVVEATNFLLQEPPGTGVTNHYYWYYATLAMYQAGGEPWRRWNEALQRQLLATQRLDGANAGSWDPDPVWGRCGGRVYSTSLCTLCLEVYYRFLPLYVEAAGRDVPAK